MSIKKRSKFGNIRTNFKGRKYDSKAEAKYAGILQGLEKEGKIKHIAYQIRYPLQDLNGTRRMAYIADFVVTTNKGKEILIDVKGILTQENKIKLAYFKYVYKKDVELVFTTGPDAFRTKFLLD